MYKRQVIRYLNRAAKYHYYQVRGYRDLIGRSLFDCHQELSRERIEAAVEKLRHHGNEIYLGVTPDNQRYYINPVRNEDGELLGYFERFELNLQKSVSYTHLDVYKRQFIGRSEYFP